jgi:hypothetical protein
MLPSMYMDMVVYDDLYTDVCWFGFVNTPSVPQLRAYFFFQIFAIA